MFNVLIFGGTTEGRQLYEFCAKNNISVYFSVTTEYGENILKKNTKIKILTGKMNYFEISDFVSRKGIKLIIDATHPYATEITQNIRAACEVNNAEYVRVIRYDASYNGKCFDTMSLAAEYLNRVSGNILFTIGSNKLSEFKHINNFSQRSAVRTLPLEKNILKCMESGIFRENIIIGQGPFSESKNIEHIKAFDVKFLVTKDSGKNGGFLEKVSAAKKCGIEIVVIKRPEEEGITVFQAEKILLESVNG